MKHLCRHIANSLTTAALCILAGLAAVMSSCSDSQREDEPSVAPRDVTIGFMLSVSDTPLTRATPEGDYNRGSGFENFIDIVNSDYKFWFFDGSDQFVDSLRITSVVPVDAVESSKTYYVLASFERSNEFDLSKHDFKVMVLSNWGVGRYPRPAKGDKIDKVCSSVDAVYDFKPEFAFPDENHPIPLYGIREYPGGIVFDNNNFASLGRIHLLRAYAKIEVTMSEKSLAEIEWVKISRYNSKGYKCPEGVYKEEDYVHGSWDKDYVQRCHIPVGAFTEGDIRFKEIGGSYFMYVPEFINAGADSPSFLTVKFKDIATEYRVNFMTNQNVYSPFDIYRNNWYRFTINKIDTDIPTELTVTVQVVPYSEVSLDPVFGVDSQRPLIPIYDENREIIYYYDSDTGFYYSPDDLTTPLGYNPFTGVEPGSGYYQVRDENNNIIYYYSPNNGRYYNTEKEEITNPTMPNGGWRVYRDKSDKVIYYHDVENDRYYNSNFEPIDKPVK